MDEAAASTNADDAVALHKTTVAEQHGSGQRSFLWTGYKKIVKRIQKSPTQAGKTVEERQSRMTQYRKQ